MMLQFVLQFVYFALLYMRALLMYIIALAAVTHESSSPKTACIAEPCLMWEMSVYKISKVVLGIFQGFIP